MSTNEPTLTTIKGKKCQLLATVRIWKSLEPDNPSEKYLESCLEFTGDDYSFDTAKDEGLLKLADLHLACAGPIAKLADQLEGRAQMLQAAAFLDGMSEDGGLDGLKRDMSRSGGPSQADIDAMLESIKRAEEKGGD